MKQLRFSAKYTNLDSMSLKAYFREISKEDLVTREEEIQLTQRYRGGDMVALNQLIRSNLRFVITVAKQYEGLGMDLSDLISEGNIGLMKAAKRFDPEKGYKFISYAIFWIRQNILKALNESSRMIRLPYAQLELIQKMQRTFAQMEQEYGWEPSADQVGEALGVDTSDIQAALQHTRKPASLDTPVGEEKDTTLADMLVDTTANPVNKLAQEGLDQQLQDFLGQLDVREMEIIRLNFGLGGTDALQLKQIAKKLGIGRERVRQLKERALMKLRRSDLATVLKQQL